MEIAHVEAPDVLRFEAGGVIADNPVLNRIDRPQVKVASIERCQRTGREIEVEIVKEDVAYPARTVRIEE